jgi:aryl-alcohol dehydrogenase-like predicted oxidoreductase
MIIATKVAMLDTRKGLSASNIAAALDDSLARLGTDYIDLYYAHQDDQETPLVETLGAFDAAVNAGKVRALGASNYSQERLQEALNISKESGFASYVALQTWFNLLDQDKLPTSYRSFCIANNIGVLPFYGVARGFLTGKYRPGLTVESVRASGVESYSNDRGWNTLAKLEEIGKVHGAPIASVALAWLRAQESIVAPIASARIASQLDDLLPTPQLTDQELAALTKVGA